ncbi:glycerophosphodiester phosphodiesterase [Streptomyces purpurogeneiscleroticus]|uniref:glycerophosphodiester phosphodiesterase n=1 Tax=Streptomyces purpurogeneiscleroticus TaxID=68259 RepID=UPI001CBB9F8F|nr:glycerophosphodiester phosphodiesterase family protein [Streptomyces purpurogeneiscleroticus]MBZ4015190.1 glycerophosphodiester phosphodiesterase [Streptomyces purpurogeneiscleroticus]
MLRSAVRSAAAGLVLLFAAVLAADTGAQGGGGVAAPPAPVRLAAVQKGLPLDGPTVIAHRGAAKYAPENTLAAVDEADRRGVEWVENDVQRTKDGRLVVIHDATLERTTNAEKVYPDRSPWRVGDFTAAEIARLDAGSWFGKKFRGERVPTLASYLNRMDRNDQRLLLEIKNPEKYPGIEKQILAQLRSSGWLDAAHVMDGLVIQSFGVAAVRRVHSLQPDVRTAVLGKPSRAQLPEYARFADWINPPYKGLSSSYVSAVQSLWGPHADRMEVHTWGVSVGQARRAFSAYSVDGVIL